MKKCTFPFPPLPNVSKIFLCLFMMSERLVYPAEYDANEEEISCCLAVMGFICIYIYIFIFVYVY